MEVLSLSQWVTKVAKAVGGQAELARQLTGALHKSIDRAAVNKMAIGQRRILAEEMLAMSSISRLPLPTTDSPSLVPIIEWVSAGVLREPNSQIPESDYPSLVIGDLGRGEFFALNVVGSSMDRVSPDGSVIVVNRSDAQLLVGKFYVFEHEGEITYKRWQDGDPPYLAPFSTDPSHRPIIINTRDRLKVIGRVCRTILVL
jgi:SOS-response transcriptional repressor LexA